jgi:hypothetical protein
LAFPIGSRAFAFDDDSGMGFKRRKLDDECRDGKRRADIESDKSKECPPYPPKRTSQAAARKLPFTNAL